MRLTFALLLFVLGCGDDSAFVFDDASVPSDTGADADAVEELDGSEDTSVRDIAVDDADVMDVAMDIGPDVPTVDDTIYFEELRIMSNPEWIEGVNTSLSITTTAAFDEVELRATRDFFGAVFLEDSDERHVISDGGATFLGSAALPAGNHSLAVEWPGTVVPDPNTAHVSVRLATPPRLAASYATFSQTAAELVRPLASSILAQDPFTVRAGYRYVAHGVSGMTTCVVLRAEDVDVLLGGGTVTPLHRWGGGPAGGEVEDRIAPSPMYLDLPPGDYALVAFNEDDVEHGVVVTIDEWRLVP